MVSNSILKIKIKAFKKIKTSKTEFNAFDDGMNYNFETFEKNFVSKYVRFFLF